MTAAGWEVTAVGRAAPTAGLPREVGSVSFTLGQGQDLPEVAAHDAAVFLAQSPRYGEGLSAAPDVLGVNLVGLAEALEIARSAGVSRFLNASSGSVYRLADHAHGEASPADATGVYALSKRFGEELVQDWSSEFSVLSLRFFALYGPGQVAKLIPGLADRIRRGVPVTLEPREVAEKDPLGFRTTPCFVGDAVDAALALLQQEGDGVLNVAGPEALSVREMATEIGRVLGREPEFEVSERVRPGDLVADVSELRKRTGLPRVPFAQGIVETLEGGV